MKTLFFFCLVIFISCKKDHLEERRETFAGNQLHATVYLSSGDSIEIKIDGEDVHMSRCGAYGLQGYVSGVSKGWASLSLSTFFTCINSAGTYELNSQYTPDIRLTNGVMYESDMVLRPGRITYTVVSGNFTSGYFSDVCKDSFNNDSVIIKGTFKGVSE